MDELRERRKERLQKKALINIADMFWQYYQASIGGTHEYEGSDARAAILVTFHDDGPDVAHAGSLKWEDFSAARLAIDDRFALLRYGEDRAKRRKEWEEEARAKQEVYLRDHPYKCSHERCTDHFKTERGRQIHERTCRYLREASKGG